MGWSCLAQVLSELLHSGAYHPGLSRELRGLSAHREGPEFSEPALLILAAGEGARQSQSLLPAPLDSLPLLTGAAPPPTSALAPGPPVALSAPNKTFGARGLLQQKLVVSSGPGGGLAGLAGPRAAVRWRHSQDAVTWAASLGTPGHCLRLHPALNRGGVESTATGPTHPPEFPSLLLDGVLFKGRDQRKGGN